MAVVGAATAASTVTLDANTIILAVIGLIGTCVTGFLALRMASLAAEAKTSQESLKEIHIAVNSAKSVLETKVDDLIKQNVDLTKKVATLEENKRGSELAKAVSEVKPVVVTPVALAPASVPASAPAPVTIATTVTPVPASPAGPTSPLKEAIKDLTEAAKDTVTAADKTVEMVVKVPHV